MNDLYGSSLRVAEVSVRARISPPPPLPSLRTSEHCSADDRSLLTAQSFENDIDRDGKMDTVEITLTMPLDRGETVQHASAMLFFDYQLGDGMSVDMEGVVFVDGSSPISGQSMWVAGDLRLRQLKPIAYRATVDVYSESVLVGAPCTALKCSRTRLRLLC